MNPIIEFKDYTFKYRAQVEPTLLDINLSIYPGEKVLIVGPSGSGKSTLAHCINGLVPFSYAGESKGSLTVGGVEPAKAGVFGMSKIVGTVLQDTDGQFIGLTVGEDIAFALENDLVEPKAMFARVDAVAKEVDVTDLLKQAPTALSGGQKQRVSMAGVMVDDVDILLFDDEVIDQKDLTIPHKDMKNRDFVLVPLAQLAGYKRHPVFGITIDEMVQNLKEQHIV